jgi:starch synthase (maltosyl-transferring)
VTNCRGPAFVPQPIVESVSPQIDNGRYPAKTVVGECLPVRATIWREGQHHLAAQVLFCRDGETRLTVPMEPDGRGLDRWKALAVLDQPGLWTFVIEAWTDPWCDWLAAIRAKAARPGGPVGLASYLPHGAVLLSRAAAANGTAAALLGEAADLLRAGDATLDDKLAVLTSPGLDEAMSGGPLRDGIVRTGAHTVVVERRRALFGSWYEQFPRSTGALDEMGKPLPGTFASAAKDLGRIAGMGFDVVYLPPIHPIGVTGRKGRGGGAVVTGDPGSPWAIGSAAGGHDAVDPDLGAYSDFDDYVRAAREVGIEIAMDLALHCSPDHPWVGAHPEWFSSLPDGTMMRAGTPPREWSDIYALDFANDFEGLYSAILEVVLFWAGRGVRIFRADNPHSKPTRIWERLIADARQACPDVVFLAEAFTRPAQQHGLSKLGFSQSHTYFIWRTGKTELTEFGRSLVQNCDFMRPNLFPTTHDILPSQLHHARPQVFAIRAALAATLSPSWGIYSGYELCEGEPAGPEAPEEYRDSEKFAIRYRDFATSAAPRIAEWIADLNAARREHPALQQLRTLAFHETDNPALLAYSKHDPSSGDSVLVVVSLNPDAAETGTLTLDLARLGPRAACSDAILCARHTKSQVALGPSLDVSVDPAERVAHLYSLQTRSHA